MDEAMLKMAQAVVAPLKARIGGLKIKMDGIKRMRNIQRKAGPPWLGAFNTTHAAEVTTGDGVFDVNVRSRSGCRTFNYATRKETDRRGSFDLFLKKLNVKPSSCYHRECVEQCTSCEVGYAFMVNHMEKSGQRTMKRGSCVKWAHAERQEVLKCASLHGGTPGAFLTVTPSLSHRLYSFQVFFCRTEILCVPKWC
jgi:hypothetical protein